MNETIADTDAQAATRVRVARTRAALSDAPDAVAHLRELLEPGDGRTERGVDIRYERTPLLTAVADDADETYQLLANWTTEWATVLMIAPPATAVVAYRIFGRRDDSAVKGFKAGTTPGGARALTLLLTMWLLSHEDQIARHDRAPQFQDEVARQVWRIRGSHGLTEPRPIQYALKRTCPFGHGEVRAVFFGEPMEAADLRGEFDFELADYQPGSAIPDPKRDPSSRAGRQLLDAVDGVRVECGYCGWMAKPKVGQIAEWLG